MVNGSNERARIDSSGRLKVGDNTRPASDANEGAQLRVAGAPLTRNQYYSPHGHYFGSIGYTDNTNTKAWLAVDSAYAQSSAVSAGIFLSAFHQDAGGSSCGFTIKNLKTGNPLVISSVTTAASVSNPAVETERLRITSDGNMGLGLTPAYSGLFGGSQRTLQIGGTAAPCLRITSSTSNQADLVIHAGNSGRRADIANMTENGSISMWTKPTGGSITERLNISADGYVTKPNHPAFKCSIASQSSPNTGVVSENNGFTLATSGSRDAFNTGSHFSEATGRFTAPVTGLYFFHFSVMRYSSNGSGSMDLRIKKNSGLIYARSYKASYSTNFEGMNLTTITNMTAGHFVEFILGANMSVYHDDSYMLGYLIG